MLSRSVPVVVFSCLVGGCFGTYEGRQAEMYENLRARAAFDLQCDGSQLEVTRLTDNAAGVTGCGQRATYVGHQCTGNYFADRCTWMMDNGHLEAPAD